MRSERQMTSDALPRGQSLFSSMEVAIARSLNPGIARRSEAAQNGPGHSV
jgi:hypothetical protein